tara:strand:+ start:2782 stop:5847 length:3066 start_codon:yes stop_codon:yes gene_type:complete
MSVKEQSIYSEYFNYIDKYNTEYGEKTIVLLQVGAFFEIYGIQMNDKIVGSQIESIADICKLNISSKSQKYNDSRLWDTPLDSRALVQNGTIVMAGFRDYSIDKYIPLITDNGYTVAVYIQMKDGKNVYRELDKVYSAGTYISCDTDTNSQISNNIMTIWFDVFKSRRNTTKKTTGTLIYGVSVVNIFTGQSSIFQHETDNYINVTSFDELERYISIYNPSEVIIISPFDESTLQSIIQYSNILISTVHFLDSRDETKTKIAKCTNQKYLKELLTFFYKEDTYDICQQFQQYPLATQSFCYLLNFIQEHNPNLNKKISIPEFNNTSNRVILANHTLLQLNLINDASVDSKKMGKLSSVMSLLNKCCSPMGRRLFQNNFTNPTFDEEWLQIEYDMIDIILQDGNIEMIDSLRKQMQKIKDIDKISRQLVLNKIYPRTIASLFSSLDHTQQMNICLYENHIITKYLCSNIVNDDDINCSSLIERKITDVMSFLEKNLLIEECKSINSMTTFTSNIIQKGISKELDDVIYQYELSLSHFREIHKIFNGFFRFHGVNTGDTDYVKIHETEKSGSMLQITNKRCTILKTLLESAKHQVIPIDEDLNISFNIDDIKYVKATGTNMEITFPVLAKICKANLDYKITLNKLIGEAYLDVLSKLEEKHFEDIEQISSYVARLDVLQSKAYIAKNNNYCKPVINTKLQKSGFNAENLRHCLIEHIQQDEIYVPNDISIGAEENSQDGVLLYGTNAVGKTSLIRSIGVSIIMAQTGMYVPCSSFVYKPYTAIYSRILGNDNIFKGLSTFAVEMSELRVILKMADENSLILGDELCSGTETESALSIFVAGLLELNKRESSYIFATHFHEIVSYDEIVSLHKLTQMHMEVRYDRETDSLIYNRKLKEGSGPRIYGLEVCKSLHLDEEFLEKAYEIRNKYYPETRGILSNKQSTYNAKKIRGICEMCNKNMGEEVHHLQHQEHANEDGFINSFHKNHKANLLTVCEECHDTLHNTENNHKIIKKMKTTTGMKLI